MIITLINIENKPKKLLMISMCIKKAYFIKIIKIITINMENIKKLENIDITINRKIKIKLPLKNS